MSAEAVHAQMRAEKVAMAHQLNKRLHQAADEVPKDRAIKGAVLDTIEPLVDCAASMQAQILMLSLAVKHLNEDVQRSRPLWRRALDWIKARRPE